MATRSFTSTSAAIRNVRSSYVGKVNWLLCTLNLIVRVFGMGDEGGGATSYGGAFRI